MPKGLFIDKRLRNSTVSSGKGNGRTMLQCANSDRGRVVFSPSLRRLMLKTQVFALATDTVRNRLTHSMEVAHVGMYIAEEIFVRITEQCEKEEDGYEKLEPWKKLIENHGYKQAIRIFVEVACLVHDIGNPPFGHFGEKAICDWFGKKQNNKADWVATIDNENFKDFTVFDGNKQGFRILTKLQRNVDDKYGLNLTCTQLASTIKYPELKEKKGSFFESERSIVSSIWKELGLKKENRHPLSLIMEAADDIAYCISDIEDSYERGLITKEFIKDSFFDFLEKESIDPDEMSFSNLYTKIRTNITKQLVEDAAMEFVARIKDSTERGQNPLLDDKAGYLKQFKEIASEKVYSSPVVLSNEITGFAVIQGLLDRFESLLLMGRKNFRLIARAVADGKSLYDIDVCEITNGLTQEPGIIARFPKKHLSVYLDETGTTEAVSDSCEMHFRTHLVVDFVSGMTDSFALNLYRLMTGQVVHESNN